MVGSPCSLSDLQAPSPISQFKASNLRLSTFFIVHLSHPDMTYGKTIALTRRTFIGKAMIQLFNMLSNLFITFLPSRKHLLVSWLQSPSAVISEPPPPPNKACHCFLIYFS